MNKSEKSNKTSIGWRKFGHRRKPEEVTQERYSSPRSTQAIFSDTLTTSPTSSRLNSSIQLPRGESYSHSPEHGNRPSPTRRDSHSSQYPEVPIRPPIARNGSTSSRLSVHVYTNGNANPDQQRSPGNLSRQNSSSCNNHQRWEKTDAGVPILYRTTSRPVSRARHESQDEFRRDRESDRERGRGDRHSPPSNAANGRSASRTSRTSPDYATYRYVEPNTNPSPVSRRGSRSSRPEILQRESHDKRYDHSPRRPTIPTRGSSTYSTKMNGDSRPNGSTDVEFNPKTMSIIRYRRDAGGLRENLRERFDVVHKLSTNPTVEKLLWSSPYHFPYTKPDGKPGWMRKCPHTSLDRTGCAETCRQLHEDFEISPSTICPETIALNDENNYSICVVPPRHPCLAKAELSFDGGLKTLEDKGKLNSDNQRRMSERFIEWSITPEGKSRLTLEKVFRDSERIYLRRGETLNFYKDELKREMEENEKSKKKFHDASAILAEFGDYLGGIVDAQKGSQLSNKRQSATNSIDKNWEEVLKSLNVLESEANVKFDNLRSALMGNVETSVNEIKSIRAIREGLGFKGQKDKEMTERVGHRGFMSTNGVTTNKPNGLPRKRSVTFDLGSKESLISDLADTVGNASIIGDTITAGKIHSEADIDIVEKKYSQVISRATSLLGDCNKSFGIIKSRIKSTKDTILNNRTSITNNNSGNTARTSTSTSINGELDWEKLGRYVHTLNTAQCTIDGMRQDLQDSDKTTRLQDRIDKQQVTLNDQENTLIALRRSLVG